MSAKLILENKSSSSITLVAEQKLNMKTLVLKVTRDLIIYIF